MRLFVVTGIVLYVSPFIRTVEAKMRSFLAKAIRQRQRLGALFRSTGAVCIADSEYHWRCAL